MILFTCVNLNAQEKPILELKTVVIDAGHGGNDPGTVWEGIREKDINLDVAVRLGSLIKSNYPAVKVIYTRDKDAYIPLSERSAIANRAKADLFISIHVNSVKGASSARGTETFLMGTDKSGRNMDVCKRENSVILLEEDYSTKYAGYDPDAPDSFIFFNLMQNAQFEQSVTMASFVENKMAKGPIANSRGIKQAPLLVLWQTTMPSVLVEIGFLSNPSDREKLKDRKSRGEIAKCLFDAFAEFKEQYEVVGERKVIDTEKIFAEVPVDTAATVVAVAAAPAKGTTKAVTKVKKETETTVKKEAPKVKKDTVATAKKEVAKVKKDTVVTVKKEAPKVKKDTVVTAKKEAAKVKKDTVVTAKKEVAKVKKDTVATAKKEVVKVKKESPTVKKEKEVKPKTAPVAAASVVKSKPVEKAPAPEIKPAPEVKKDLTKYKFRIQIMAASKNIKTDAPVFKGVDCECVKVGELYKYFTGKFNSRFDASSALLEIKQLFPGSFIVEFGEDGKPLK